VGKSQITFTETSNFYNAMHHNAKHGLAIACRLSVHLSVRLSRPHRLKILETMQTISPTSSLFVAQRSPPYSEGNMEKFSGD